MILLWGYLLLRIISGMTHTHMLTHRSTHRLYSNSPILTFPYWRVSQDPPCPVGCVWTDVTSSAFEVPSVGDKKVNAVPNRAASPEGCGSLRRFKVRHRLHVQRPRLLCLSLSLIFSPPYCVIRKRWECTVPGEAEIIMCVSFRSVFYWNCDQESTYHPSNYCFTTTSRMDYIIPYIVIILIFLFFYFNS